MTIVSIRLSQMTGNYFSTINLSGETCVYGENNCRVLEKRNTLLVAQGNSFNEDTLSTEIIDLSGRDRQCSNFADAPYGTTGAVGTFFNGRPLMCGGFQHLTRDNIEFCLEYNLDENRWDQSASIQLSFPRQDPGSVELPNGSWWVTGGISVSKNTHVYQLFNS